MRLVDGTGPHEGRVEFCTQCTWTTVCGVAWDHREAGVVCAQLGYQREGIGIRCYHF